LFTSQYAESIAQAKQREYESKAKETQALQEQLLANQRRINDLRG